MSSAFVLDNPDLSSEDVRDTPIKSLSSTSRLVNSSGGLRERVEVAKLPRISSTEEPPVVVRNAQFIRSTGLRTPAASYELLQGTTPSLASNGTITDRTLSRRTARAINAWSHAAFGCACIAGTLFFTLDLALLPRVFLALFSLGLGVSSFGMVTTSRKG